MRKVLMALLLSVIIFSLNGENKRAEENEPNVLVIYSSKDGEVDEYQRMLDLLIGHFTTDITFKNSQEMTGEDLKGVTHLFYYGQVAEELPASYATLFDEYEGKFIAIGYNTERLGDQFTFIEPMHEQVIDQLSVEEETKNWDMTPEYIIEVQASVESKVLVEGHYRAYKTVYPVMIQNANHYYIAFDNLQGVKKVVIGDLFHDIFEASHEEERRAYIRLEDIHPLVDPKNVKAITTILKEKNIPFMMAVIPVYTNPDTGQQTHFSDSPELLKVLKAAQKNGGSIVLHGYTHQYRGSETGEGFEFWDVENNRPIYAAANETFTLRTAEDFGNDADYDSYLKELEDFETNYIEEKITRGIQELANYGLYPLAFEAPHYTMSQNGYQVVAKYFSTYVGQVQISDMDWEIMDTAPFITTPSFLYGMTLLPETMGYVLPEDPQSIANMMARGEPYEETTDGVLGAFYHPYLGVDQFLALIEEMEALQGISWLHLQDKKGWVQADYVDISTMPGGMKANVQQSKLLFSSSDFPIYHLKRLLPIILWAIAAIGGAAVLAFIGFIFYLSLKRTKKEG